MLLRSLRHHIFQKLKDPNSQQNIVPARLSKLSKDLLPFPLQDTSRLFRRVAYVLAFRHLINILRGPLTNLFPLECNVRHEALNSAGIQLTLRVLVINPICNNHWVLQLQIVPGKIFANAGYILSRPVDINTVGPVLPLN